MVHASKIFIESITELSPDCMKRSGMQSWYSAMSGES